MDRPDLRYPAGQLAQRSLEVLLENQSPSGAFIASPNFPTYAFSWFRDSSYIAYALDLYGEHPAARRFHNWAANAINRRASIAAHALERANNGLPLGNADVLHTRYTLAGEDDPQGTWENFQLDGFGAWLWALEQHQHLSGAPLPEEWARAARIAAGYIEGLWRQPCYDCWEEFGGEHHPHTLAAIYGGLRSFDMLTGETHTVTMDAIRAFILENAIGNGRFQKFLGNSQVDASLLGLSIPFGVVDPCDPRMRCTVEKIEEDLCKGGVYRYATDTYYGGGQWILLAAWLGWYWCEAGQPLRAKELCSWIESQADARGWLPEQVPVMVNDQDYYPRWLEKWGPIAHPLLWSHAEYLILRKKLENLR
jgi:GH15 family glucan-1,4-alpha-glucosidase